MLLSLSKLTGFPALLRGGRFPEFLQKQCGIKYLKPPPTFDDVYMPEHPRPLQVPKVPVLPNGQKNIKMPRMINLMRYPEKVHNKLIHKQYGVVAIRGGRLKTCHFELIRNTIIRQIDFKRMFFTWRVDAPWQSCTKRPTGFTLGGGKGHIHHYVTPVGPDRVIFEIGGKCEYDEVRGLLESLAAKMPFNAKAVCYESMLRDEQKEKNAKEMNMNPYTWEYMIKNDLLGCRKYTKKIDFKYFGKYP